jgi:hypothetical protein
MNYKTLLLISLVISCAYAGIDTTDAEDAWADKGWWEEENFDDYDDCRADCECTGTCADNVANN